MKKTALIITGIIALLLAAAAFILLSPEEKALITRGPTLTVESPQKIHLSETEEFTLDVSISSLGDALYPAASMSIKFDPAHLEFLGVKEGNVFVYDSARSGSLVGKLPEWSCNIEQSNKSGIINIMYLDLSGGREAFSKELLAEDDNVVLRLSFRLRGSARAGDVYELSVQDAVFAASDEAESLAVTRNTLKTKNSRIVIGE